MLEYLPTDKLREHWPFIETGLKRILDRSPDRWIPPDVYSMAIQGHVGVYLYRNPSIDGFVVLQPIAAWDGKDCNVFAAYSTSGVDTEVLEATKQEAVKMGCKRLVFHSKRMGWDKRAEQMGYKRGHTLWEMEL